MQRAVRVTLVKMYNTNPADTENEACPPRPLEVFGKELPDLSAFEGHVRWVAPPANFPEDTGSSSDPNQWVGAPLQCCPAFREWTTEMDAACAPRCTGATCRFVRHPPKCNADEECPPPFCDTTVLHVFAKAVVPCSQYKVQLVDVSCADLEDESCYSDALTIHTAKWGDVWAPSGGSSQPNFTDIGKVIDKLKFITPPAKVQVLLRSNEPQARFAISFSDVGRAVDGFKSIAYPEVGPSACVEPCE